MEGFCANAKTPTLAGDTGTSLARRPGPLRRKRPATTPGEGLNVSYARNLLVRLEPAFRAVVSDHQVDLHVSGAGEPWHCETLPALYPLNYLINDFTTAPRPVWQTGYGYPEGLDPLYRFFSRRLAAP